MTSSMYTTTHKWNFGEQVQIEGNIDPILPECPIHKNHN